jgi:hypothetical protein
MAWFKRASAEERFWQWFEQNSSRLFAFETDRDRVFRDLTAALHKVHKGLTFEFGPVEKGKREFIVSADGIKERFPAVQNLVAAAPPMSQWIVIPFRPPKNITGSVVEYGGHRVGPEDVWFRSEADGDRIGLTLYVRGLTDENRNAVCGAAFILLDNALGEFAVETRAGFIEWNELPDDPEAAGLTPFPAIRETFDVVIH